VDTDLSALPDDVEALKAALIATRAEVASENALAVATAAEFAQGRAVIAHLNLEIESCGRLTELAQSAPPAARSGCVSACNFGSGSDLVMFTRRR
jgi:hypothetical protein